MILEESVIAYSRYYPGIWLEGLRKRTWILSHDNRCPGRDSNGARPKSSLRGIPLDQSARC
jgi:hypothetical protein